MRSNLLIRRKLEIEKIKKKEMQKNLHDDKEDGDLLWMYEMYDDQAALELHMGSDSFKALGPAITPFLGGRPEPGHQVVGHGHSSAVTQ